jgi:hypothetical protein
MAISSIPVCPDPRKLSLKSGLAEVNIVHLHSGHGGGLGGRKNEATRGEKKMMSAAQAEPKKSSDTDSWGAVQSVTAFRKAGLSTKSIQTLHFPAFVLQSAYMI